MKIKNLNLWLLLGVVIALASCSTAYQAGQTPDDVYSSPEPPAQEYAKVKKTDEKRYRAYDDEDEYEDYDDRYLRMKVRNRYRWSALDDWYFYGDRYNFSYYNNWVYWNDPFFWNTPWSPVSYWNMWYTPWYYRWYAGWGGWYGPGWGWYDPWWGGWYAGWWGSRYGGWYGYGPGIIVGRRANYGPRTTNYGAYNRTSTGTTNYRRTYGVRSNSSTYTHSGNSNVNTARSYNLNRGSSNYSTRSYSTDTYSRIPTTETRSYSSPSFNSGGRSSGSSVGRSGGVGGRRF